MQLDVLHLGLRAIECYLLLCFHFFGVRWVFSTVTGCFGPC